MNRSDISELHFIAPIANVPSILEHGILSHRQAGRLTHASVAMQEVQERRKNKQIPGARPLHDYANLYFDAHNPMLSKRRSQNNEICVLRVSPDVLDLPDIIIADRNAASQWVRFYKSAEGLTQLDRDMVFAHYWTHQDQFQAWEHKSIKCAEVLVPDKIKPRLIIGAYVANQMALACFQALKASLPATVKLDIFF